MMTPILTTIVALGLATAPVRGVAPPRPAASDTAAHARPITVQVENDNFLDVDVYARSQGMTWRLGTVAGMERTTFTVPQGIVVPDAEMRLVFAPIGGWDYWVSPPVLVSPGDKLVSQVGSMLDLSTVGAM